MDSTTTGAAIGNKLHDPQQTAVRTEKKKGTTLACPRNWNNPATTLGTHRELSSSNSRRIQSWTNFCTTLEQHWETPAQLVEPPWNTLEPLGKRKNNLIANLEQNWNTFWTTQEKPWNNPGLTWSLIVNPLPSSSFSLQHPEPPPSISFWTLSISLSSTGHWPQRNPNARFRRAVRGDGVWTEDGTPRRAHMTPQTHLFLVVSTHVTVAPPFTNVTSLAQRWVEHFTLSQQSSCRHMFRHNLLGVPDALPPFPSNYLGHSLAADGIRFYFRQSTGQSLFCWTEPPHKLWARTSSKSSSEHTLTSLREKTASTPMWMTSLPQSKRLTSPEFQQRDNVLHHCVHLWPRSKCERLWCLWLAVCSSKRQPTTDIFQCGWSPGKRPI